MRTSIRFVAAAAVWLTSCAAAYAQSITWALSNPSGAAGPTAGDAIVDTSGQAIGRVRAVKGQFAEIETRHGILRVPRGGVTKAGSRSTIPLTDAQIAKLMELVASNMASHSVKQAKADR